MSSWRLDNWGGNITGEIIFAHAPFQDRIGHCFIKKDSIRLLNGVSVEGAKGNPISDYLAVGTLAVAVQHIGDYFNKYVPITLTPDDKAGAVLTPFVDLEFGAYAYGQRVGRLETADVRKIAAGLAIHYAELDFETQLQLSQLKLSHDSFC